MVMIKVGDTLPDVMAKEMAPEGPHDVSILSACGPGMAVIFAVPGAYTPACSAQHLPGFLQRVDAFKDKGVSTVICLAVNDVFVMDAWARANKVGGRIRMLADGNGTVTRALGLELDLRPYGLGVRSQRFAMIVSQGKVTKLFVDEPGAFQFTAAGHVLANL